jgi:transcriptional regulator with XRE-family HTH domain
MAIKSNTHNDMRRLGAAIRILRVDQGLSQDELARRVRLHRTYIGAIERGEKNMTLESIGTIAKEFEISISELLKQAEL